MIGVFSIVLIGLREWENPSKNCDILTIYDANQIEQLKNIPSIKMDHIIKTSLGNTFTGTSKASGDDVVFTEDDDEFVGDLTKCKVREEFKMETVDAINFDDI